jgi:hypothetical protein
VILVRFDVPPGWCLRGTQPSNDGDEIAVWLDSSFPGTYAAIWMRRGQNSPCADSGAAAGRDRRFG